MVNPAPQPTSVYLDHVEEFAGLIISHPKGTCGPVHNHLWPGVVDTRTFEIPAIHEMVLLHNVRATMTGAVWGSNYSPNLPCALLYQTSCKQNENVIVNNL